MTRKSRAEVIMDVLTEALDGANKTRIMYRANLNFLRLRAHCSRRRLGEAGCASE
jgi:predicted transcriptional regulator